jgi:hypothetical protein
MKTLVGKTALLGMTIVDKHNQLVEQQQFVGRIEEADRESGIVIRSENGEKRTIPPDFRAVLFAPRGRYTHRATGEVTTDPDFLLSWRMRLAAEPDGPSEWAPNYAPFYQSVTPQEWDLEYRVAERYLEELIESVAPDYIGKRLLIGVAYCESEDEKETLPRQEQLLGMIVQVTRKDGLVVQLDDGSVYKLPPDLSLIQPAPAGQYRLRSSGEVVNDPDFITKWNRTETGIKPKLDSSAPIEP